MDREVTPALGLVFVCAIGAGVAAILLAVFAGLEGPSWAAVGFVAGALLLGAWVAVQLATPGEPLS